jgi:serine/threonine protein kinase
MAPEQIEGRTADARTDIFAFGAVLYEMLTGRRAFEGASTPAVMAAILRADAPSLESVKPPLPRALARVVQTCLAKDPEDRYSTVHDLLLELRGIQTDAREPLQTIAGPAVPSRRRLWPIAAALAASIGLAGFWLGTLNRPPQVPAEQTSLDLVPPQGTNSYGGFALSRPMAVRSQWLHRQRRAPTSGSESSPRRTTSDFRARTVA